MISAAFAALFFVASPNAVVMPVACSGCSCRGGPGYRAGDGKCVGWKELKRKCGDPPTTRCTDERDGKRRDGTNKEDDEE